jgi:hypothetical protein
VDVGGRERGVGSHEICVGVEEDGKFETLKWQGNLKE